jgi:hypothetical protein
MVFDVSLLDTTLQHRDDCFDYLPSYIRLENANFDKHQSRACCEKLSGSSKTAGSKRALTEALIRDGNSARIPIGVAGNLAEYPVPTACVG